MCRVTTQQSCRTHQSYLRILGYLGTLWVRKTQFGPDFKPSSHDIHGNIPLLQGASCSSPVQPSPYSVALHLRHAEWRFTRQSRGSSSVSRPTHSFPCHYQGDGSHPHPHLTLPPSILSHSQTSSVPFFLANRDKQQSPPRAPPKTPKPANSPNTNPPAASTALT